MRTRRIAFASVLAAVAAAVPAAPAMAAGNVTVMTRNLYLGADIIGLATAADKADFQKNASAMFRTVEATNFPYRAKGLAKEVKTTRPDLIGLQEVALWRTGALESSEPATTVKYDFVTELLSALKKQKQSYTVVASQEEFDFEGPTETEDVRLTMRDVILKRKGSKVKTTGVTQGNYETMFTTTTPVGVAEVKRGWAAVDGRIGSKPFRFLNTHLEAYDVPPGTRAAQAGELFETGGPLSGTELPTIVVGDFNSDPADASSDGAAYRVFSSGGFADVYGKKRALTFGQNELLDKKTAFSDFIDHIMYRGAGWKVNSKRVVGDKTFSRTAPLWASDHAGIVAKLTLK